jgi:chromosome segregation ATPase
MLGEAVTRVHEDAIHNPGKITTVHSVTHSCVEDKTYLNEVSKMFDFDSIRRQQAMMVDLFSDLMSRSKTLQGKSFSMSNHYTEVVSTNLNMSSQLEYLKGEFATQEERLRVSTQQLETADSDLIHTRTELSDAHLEISKVRDKLLAESTATKEAQRSLQDLDRSM